MKISIARQVAKKGSQQGGCRTTGERNGENARDDVNRVYEQRKRKQKKKPKKVHTKHTPETKPPHSGHEYSMQVRWVFAWGSKVNVSGDRTTLHFFSKKKAHFARVCLAKNTAGKDSRRHHAHQLGQFANTENTSDSDYVFSLPKSAAARPRVKVTINGVKGRMDADS